MQSGPWPRARSTRSVMYEPPSSGGLYPSHWLDAPLPTTPSIAMSRTTSAWKKIIRNWKNAGALISKHFVDATKRLFSRLTLIWSIMARNLRKIRGWLCSQWPGLLALSLGFGLLGATLVIKHMDAPAIENIDSQAVPEFGIYSDASGFDAFNEYPDGVEHSLGNWSVSAIPGEPWKVTVSWLRFASEDFPINVAEPKSVLIKLPQGARIVEGVTVLKYRDGACATWNDEEGSGTVTPEVVVSDANSAVWVTCTIPAVGQVQSLVSEMTFEWNSPVRGSSGIGRMRDAISFPPFSWGASNLSQNFSENVILPETAALQPFTFTINSKNNQKIVEVFPDPEDGGVGQRSWAFSYKDSDPEIEFVTQSEGDRVWINPVTDTLLLLGGTALGLVTAFWRKKAR